MDAERNVLSAVLSAAAHYWRVADRVRPEDFSTEGYRALWAVIARRMGQGKPADVVSIADAEPDYADLAYGLLDGFVSAAQLEHHADTIRQAADVRRLRTAGQRIAHLTGEHAFAEAQAILADCQPATRDSVKSTKDGLREMVAVLERRLKDRANVDGLSWGIPALDALYMPEPEHLCVIAARPKMGKTTLTMQLAIRAAQAGKRGYIASLEMSLRELTERGTAHLGNLPMDWIKRPSDAPDEAMSRVLTGAEHLEALPLLINANPGRTVQEVCAEATQLHMADPLGFVVVDHLGLLALPRKNREDVELGDCTTALKGLAKRLKVPVILVVQLNRDSERRADREPQVADLRGSGRIEEDADAAVMLFRDPRGNPGLAKALLRLNRHGEAGEVTMREHLARMRFEGTSDEWTTGRPVEAGGGRTFASRFSGKRNAAAIP